MKCPIKQDHDLYKTEYIPDIDMMYLSFASTGFKTSGTVLTLPCDTHLMIDHETGELLGVSFLNYSHWVKKSKEGKQYFNANNEEVFDYEENYEKWMKKEVKKKNIKGKVKK